MPDTEEPRTNSAVLESPAVGSDVVRDAEGVDDASGASRSAPDDLAQRRDLHLVERSLSGDLDAFNELVGFHQDHLWALVARIVPDRDQASDAVQEAFFNAFRNLRSFRGGSVRSWLGRIAINAAMDTQRARKRRPV